MTPSFRRGLMALGATDREAAARAYRQFRSDPFHNSLRFKRLSGHEALWSVRVTISVRTVGHRDGDTVSWLWIGPHGEFDKKFA